jgi:hypothetical protein
VDEQKASLSASSEADLHAGKTTAGEQGESGRMRLSLGVSISILGLDFDAKASRKEAKTEARESSEAVFCFF